MKQIIILTVVYLITLKNFTFAKYLVYVNEDDLSPRKQRDVGPSKLGELVEAGAKVAYLKSYDDGSDGANERGYFKASEDKGNSGYKHYDSFHKKDGDKYGYETHSAFGKASGAENEAEGSKYTHKDDENEKADEQLKDTQLEENETKNAYKVVDDESDGNDYTQGNVSGYSEKYVAEDEDSQDAPAHYEAENVEEYGTGNYESQGNLIHDEGNSPYTYDGETNTDSAHYSAADYEGDY